MSSLLEGYQASWRGKLRTPGCVRGSRQWEALRALPLGGSLLDLGCGDGGFLLEAQNRCDEALGVEGSTEAAERATRQGLRVVQADLTELPLPFPDKRFDSVTCLDVIEHVPDPRTLLSEAARLLRPGGTLIVTTPNIRYLKRIGALLFAGRFPKTSQDPEPYDGGHFHFFTFKDITTLIDAAGMRTVTRRGIIPSRTMSPLRAVSGWWPVREFLSDGALLTARK